MLLRLSLAVTVGVVALTACGSGDTDGVRSGQDVADLVGCTDFTDDSEEMFTTEGGSCKLDGETLYVYYFADNDARDNYLDIGGDFGGLYLIGDGYVIEGKRATLDALQDDIGGAFSDE